MKVLHILCELNPSGAETMLLSAAPFLQNQNIHSEILSTGTNVGIFAETLNQAGYKIHHIPFRKSVNYFINLYQLFTKEKYDSIHVHTEQGSFWVTIIALLSRLPAKRCVKTIHATFQFTGNLRWRRAWQRQLLSFLGIPHIAISKSVQDTELKYFGIKTEIIPNWYDSTRFTKTADLAYKSNRQLLNLTDDQFVIVTVGNCATVKNHTALIEAIAKLDNNNVVYLHIGKENDCNEQDSAKNLGINNQVNFLGIQNNILPFLQAADLYVMPSLVEGFGIAALEAIATEIPILLTNVPGLSNFNKIFNGLHYCEPDADAIKNALEIILKTPKANLRASCHNTSKLAKLNFGIDKSVSAYISHYKS